MEFNGSMILPLALLIDALIGEPQWIYKRLPHPVIIMADFLNMGEQFFNDLKTSYCRRKLGGIFVIISGVIFVGLIGFFIENFLQITIWGELLLALLVSSLLAGRSLFDCV